MGRKVIRWSSAALLTFLAACSDGLQTDEVPTDLAAQATGTFTKQIGFSTDDAEETTSGLVVIDSLDLDLGLSKTDVPTTIGLRFSGVTIPKGATITSASITFKAYESNTADATFSLRGQAADNAAAFTTTTSSISTRAKTNASVSWAVAGWGAGEEGADTTSPDLKNIVQEVVNRTGWNDGNALVFFVTGSNGKRLAHSADSSVTRSPTLQVTYTYDDATAPINMGALAAFPNAQGYGTQTKGGRGGKVIYVTTRADTLDSTGKPVPGTLRYALEYPVSDLDKRRTVLFKVGGIFELGKQINIDDPNITIAGQTAPGSGVNIKATSNLAGPLINITTNNIVMRYLRLRRGPGSNPSENGDNLQIVGGYNIVLDHNSFSWSVDESVSTYTAGKTATDNREPYNITMSWNIISEALSNSTHGGGENEHSKNLFTAPAVSKGQISLHHNLMAHGIDRNPLIFNSGPTDVINNVVYNSFYNMGARWTKTTEETSDSQRVNIIGNYFKWGESRTRIEGTSIAQASGRPLILLYGKGDAATANPLSVFIGIGSGGEDLNANYAESRKMTWSSQSELNQDDVRHTADKVSEVYSRHPNSSITTTSAATALDQVLSRAGATLPARDSIDARIVSDTRNRTGEVIDHPSEVGGWSSITNSSKTVNDADTDGLPYDWEVARGLNPNNTADGSADRDGDGYTNLEEYLEGVVRGLW